MAVSYSVQLALRACEDYRRGGISLGGLGERLWTASKEARSDERELEEFLQTSEGRLDSLQFTTEPSKLDDAVSALLDTVESFLEEWGKRGAT